jgi:hypothetical protein
MHRLRLIFAHVPKAGGTAIATLLARQFGPALLHDQDRPADPSAPMNIDPAGFLERQAREGYGFLAGKAAVTGHIWPRKYEPIEADVRATILRHPVARTISHYFFWTSNFKFKEHPLRQYVVEQQLDLLSFARLPAIRHFYAGQMFRDVDMSRFDVIQRYETLEVEGEAFIAKLGVAGPIAVVNATEPLLSEAKRRERDAAKHDPKIRAALNTLLADDIRFYEGTLERAYARPPSFMTRAFSRFQSRLASVARLS